MILRSRGVVYFTLFCRSNLAPAFISIIMVNSPVSVLAVLTLDDKISQNDKITIENLSFCELPTAFDQKVIRAL